MRGSDESVLPEEAGVIGSGIFGEQVDANRVQGSELCGDEEHPPAWICGDSRNIDTTCADVEADMVFSCPPYADLEVYSDDPKDLSTMKYSDFRAVYFEIIKKACDRLKPDSFACFVVGRSGTRRETTSTSWATLCRRSAMRACTITTRRS